ncbi:Ubiquitin-like domain [Dillenia turbinata]|uniref:HECT-type E3 ubiquitin transferase n=1 Tax=Dillenia turbinata TaxID=194707 RepID=A0AAN8ZGA5_9MAGN
MSFDCLFHRLSSTKRKLDDLNDDALSDLVSVRMRKDYSSHAVNSSNGDGDDSSNLSLLSDVVSRVSNSDLSSHPQNRNLHFFVRMISQGNTLVVHANSDDTVKSLHERIQLITGIPVYEQRLIYKGKQLQWEQSLADCLIENDAGLNLVGRMRSTEYPITWQIVNELVWSICSLCRGETVCSARNVTATISEFLALASKDDSEAAKAHIQIFMSSSAPSALVMLYLSPHKGNKKCAEDCIKRFLSPSCNNLPKFVYMHCFPILLEFCKLLNRGNGGGGEDSLYVSCRSALGSLLETTGDRGGHGCCEYRKSSIAVQELFPFVSELAKRLSKDLEVSLASKLSLGSLEDIVRDFKAFLLPLLLAIKEQVGLDRPISLPFCEANYNQPCYSEEIGFLHVIFVDLLQKMNDCLDKLVGNPLPKAGEIGHNAASQYLAILKELYGISKLYLGAKEKFWTLLRERKIVVCSLITRYAKRGEDNDWLLKHKEVTDFEARRHLVMLMFPEIKDEYDELHEMLIDRSHLLAESFEYIGHADPDSLHGGLFMEFKNEEATGPGVLREWFSLVCQAIFNPENALFVACPNDRRRFFPNPVKHFVDEEWSRQNWPIPQGYPILSLDMGWDRF